MPPITWTRNRGRNGWDAPSDVGDGQSVESTNVHFYHGGLGTKRGGATAITESGLSGHNAVIEYVPAQDPTAAELFIVDNSATPKILRSAAGPSSTAITLTNLTLKDVLTEATPVTITSAVLNGKLYLAYDSLVNRMHVFDPHTSTTSVRRSGLAPFAAAATAGDTGVGTYAATLRYYQARSVEQQSSVVVRRSEANTSVAFTPNGTSASARITRPTAVNEGETHWEVYGSTDNVTFYGPLATVAIGTSTYDDSSTPSTWAATFDAEPVAGACTPFPSVKFLGTTGTRLYGLAPWETSAGDSVVPKQGRFYFSPVLDATDIHSDEIIFHTTSLEGFLDLSRNAGAVDRGVTRKPVNNVIYAFQSDQHFGLIPTESDAAPYRRVTYSGIGAVTHQSIVIADTANGASCVYFLDPVKGPYTQGGPNGLRWCGKDVKDVWDTVNTDATTLVAWGLWYPDRNQVWFAVATGSSNEPDTILVLDVTEQTVDDQGDLRGGWSVYTGTLAAARCGVMFSQTVATTRSRKRVPYVGLSSGTTLLRYDEAVTSDHGTACQALVTSGALAQATQAIEIQRTYVRASAQAGVSLQQTLTRNGGDETARVSTVSLSPAGSQTAVLRRFEDAALQDADTVQVTLGDGLATASAWTLLGWTADVKLGGPL